MYFSRVQITCRMHAWHLYVSGLKVKLMQYDYAQLDLQPRDMEADPDTLMSDCCA